METVKCALCDSGRYKFLFKTQDYDWGLPGEFNIVKCRVCGLVYINPRPGKNELEKYYPDNYFHSIDNESSGKEIADSKILQRRLKFVRKLSKTGKLLDVGTGTGLFIKMMENEGWDSFGVEPNKTAAEFAGNKLGLEVYNGELTDSKLKEGQYDLITMWEVLEHIPESNENLKEVYRLLKNNGMFIASVPNFNSLQRFLFGKRWYGLKAPTHLYHFSPKTLRAILKKCGFTDIKIYHSLINIKKPLPGYSDSLRYLLGDLKIISKRVNQPAGVQQRNFAVKRNKIKSLLVALLHTAEFLIFSAIELTGYLLGMTATLFVTAKKK
ncbi:MAG: class I SAM-dependent methyltransferase [Candidatus Firestonebacteria bacterium]